MKVTPNDLTVVCNYVYELCGIYLDNTKGYLIESRLGDIATLAGCESYAELVQKSKYSGDRKLRNEIIDAITTNETLFFRDNSPFDALRHKVLPETIDSISGSLQPRRLRIWSAACSTGQEPYSIAMTLCDLIPNIESWDISILGTDISDAALEQASRGRYAAHEIQRGLETENLTKHFTQDGDYWQVSDQLRSMISLKRINLLEPFTDFGPFEIIFCRNVAIYFTHEVRKSLFNRLSDRLTERGYLFVGSSESLNDMGPRFVPQQHCRAVYFQPNSTQTPVCI